MIHAVSSRTQFAFSPAGVTIVQVIELRKKKKILSGLIHYSFGAIGLGTK
jgi:hypothetical protein